METPIDYLTSLTVVRCYHCGHVLKTAVSPKPGEVIVIGHWTWDSDHWYHYCSDKTVSEIVLIGE